MLANKDRIAAPAAEPFNATALAVSQLLQITRNHAAHAAARFYATALAALQRRAISDHPAAMEERYSVMASAATHAVLIRARYADLAAAQSNAMAHAMCKYLQT